VLPPGDGEVTLTDPTDAPTYVLGVKAFSIAGGRGGVLLALVDVTRDPAVLIGRHDFVARPQRIRGSFVLRTSAGELVLLAELHGAEGTSACGWWLGRDRPRFLCAPKVGRASRYEARRGLLVESWQTDFPPAALSPPTRTGRMVRLSADGGWTEVDSFRCLGRPLAEAIDQAGARGMRRWQHDSVARLLRAARSQSRRFDDERAATLLRDAIATDSCAAEPWRLLGRLRFQSGRNVLATPPLAAAVALDSHDPAPLVDLADALVGLDVSTRAGREAFAVTLLLLERSRATRHLAGGVANPKALARALYRAYLQRTADRAVLHRSRRRRVERQLEVLR